MASEKEARNVTTPKKDIYVNGEINSCEEYVSPSGYVRKSNLINPAEEIFLKITTVIIQKTIPSEPDLLKVQVGDKYFEIKSTDAIDFNVFRQKWFKTLHCVLPLINAEQWIILWNKILIEKAEVVEAQEVSEAVLIGRLFIEFIWDLSIKLDFQR